MATKDLSLPFKDTITIINENSNGPYKNLNLNQASQFSSNAFSESSKNVSTKNERVLNYSKNKKNAAVLFKNL
jgi:thiamine pyrophosphokinase